MGAIIILALIAVGFAIHAHSKNEKRKATEARREKLLEWARPYVKDQCFVSVDASSLIGFDFDAKEIFLAQTGASGKYRFDEVASCELLRNDVTLTQTNRGSQVLGAVVGDVLLGPAGAVVGALTGSKRSTAQLSKVELKVVVDCQRNPVYRIVLFNYPHPKGVSPNHPNVKPILARADTFHGHLINAIRNADRASRHAMVASIPQQAQLPGGSNELGKLRELFELKQLGAISEREYEAAKIKVLGSDTIAT